MTGVQTCALPISFTFSSLFTERISLRRLVATFLALLELTRLNKLHLEQNAVFDDIHCTAVDEIALETPAFPSILAPQ